MKFAAIISYRSGKEKIKSMHPEHRAYLRKFLENGQLRAAGPFTDDAGALWIIDAQDEKEVERIIRGDPYVEAQVILNWKIQRITYWSAQEANGEK